MAKKDYQIPFDKDGNQQHYPENSYEGEYPNHRIVPPNMVDNFQFDDTLKIDDFMRGRSAAYFRLVSTTTGKKYYMFLVDLMEVIRNCTVTNGVVSGKWTFCKRGQNYGLQMVA